MARNQPTPAELEILSVLWERGPSTVRDVHETLNGRKDTGYTTVLKLLQIMTEKGLVTRDETARAHVYSTSAPEAQVQRQLVRDLLERAFGGSTSKLVMHALGARKAPREEIARIREMLDELDRPGKGGDR
jgi:BlaI family transcriptional regulator, penicillinase repressor